MVHSAANCTGILTILAVLYRRNGCITIVVQGFLVGIKLQIVSLIHKMSTPSKCSILFCVN